LQVEPVTLWLALRDARLRPAFHVPPGKEGQGLLLLVTLLL
jgi:hypothetical protein